MRRPQQHHNDLLSFTNSGRQAFSFAAFLLKSDSLKFYLISSEYRNRALIFKLPIA